VKSSFFVLSIFLFCSSFCWSKTRLGNYYVGFGVGRFDHPSQRVDVNGTRQFKEMDGVIFDVDLNLPLSHAFDFNLNFARSDFSDDNFSMHHNQLDGALFYSMHFLERKTGFLLPYVGLGLQYSETKDDKARYAGKLHTGAEFYLSESLTFSPRISYVNSFMDLNNNHFEVDLSLTWLAMKRHALALRFSKNVEVQSSTIGLQYLHSWL
jgi:hypothetical protein